MRRRLRAISFSSKLRPKTESESGRGDLSRVPKRRVRLWVKGGLRIYLIGATALAHLGANFVPLRLSPFPGAQLPTYAHSETFRYRPTARIQLPAGNRVRTHGDEGCRVRLA